VVPRSSDRISRVPPYLICPIRLPIRGCHPLWPDFPVCSGHPQGSAGPRSLATTSGVSVDFLSSGYLDVSVPRVRFLNPMYSGKRYLVMPTVDIRKDNNSKQSGGFPHSEIHGSKPIPGSPWLIAGYHVLHRLLLPRHPPNALIALDLIRKKKDFVGPPGSGLLCARSRSLPHRMHTIPACSRASRRAGSRPEAAAQHEHTLVSVLDLDNAAVAIRSEDRSAAASSRGCSRQR
jgi:hypothetical protein